MLRKFASHGATAYLGAGLFGALVMQAAVPAMNSLGVIYYALTWPAFLYCARSDLESCDPFWHLPLWLARFMFNV